MGNLLLMSEVCTEFHRGGGGGLGDARQQSFTPYQIRKLANNSAEAPIDGLMDSLI